MDARALQSALHPAGEAAQEIAVLSWVLFGGAAVILAAVIALTAFAVLGQPRERRWLAGERVIVIGGLAVPVVVLSALLVYGLTLTRPAAGAPALRLRVTGEQWWWRVEYLDAQGRVVLSTANELRLPVGQPAELLLQTADVIHSFWVPSLAGKLDMVPGHVNSLRLTPTEAGTFRGQCAEYCGGPHGLMAFYVVALSPEAFRAWYAAERQPAAEPGNDFLRRGRDVFLAAGCGACHTIRGTAAVGRLAPELTHVGSRVSIGAGLLPTNVGTLAGWIADSQHLKPDNRMPSFNLLGGADLRAVAAYLASLR